MSLIQWALNYFVAIGPVGSESYDDCHEKRVTNRAAAALDSRIDGDIL
jgi:hypothetical protein